MDPKKKKILNQDKSISNVTKNKMMQQRDKNGESENEMTQKTNWIKKLD